MNGDGRVAPWAKPFVEAEEPERPPAQPPSASPPLTILDRVLALCEDNEERSDIRQACLELKIGTTGAELNFLFLDLTLHRLERRRQARLNPTPVVVVSVDQEKKPQPVPVRAISRHAVSLRVDSMNRVWWLVLAAFIVACVGVSLTSWIVARFSLHAFITETVIISLLLGVAVGWSACYRLSD
jgi:hypothetical protein